MLRKLLAISVFGGALSAQGPVTPATMYHRVYAVVPMVGSGTFADPRRPLLAPVTSALSAQPNSNRSGIRAYQMVASDDGQFALVEFVFATPLMYHDFLSATAAALHISVGATPVLQNGASIQAATTALEQSLQVALPGLQLFTRGLVTKAQIETAFQQRKAGFVLDTLVPVTLP